jgi:hypothetical protein
LRKPCRARLRAQRIASPTHEALLLWLACHRPGLRTPLKPWASPCGPSGKFRIAARHRPGASGPRHRRTAVNHLPDGVAKPRSFASVDETRAIADCGTKRCDRLFIIYKTLS